MMEVDETVVAYIATTYYNMIPKEGSIALLAGYSDKNYVLADSSDNKKYAMKIVNKDESIPELTDIIDEVIDNVHNYCSRNEDTLLFTVPKLMRTCANRLSAYTHIRHTVHSESIGTIQCNVKLSEYFPSITVMNIFESRDYSDEELFFDLGKICGQLFKFLRTQQHLRDKLTKARGEDFPWQLSTCDKVIESNLKILFPQGADKLDATELHKWQLVHQVLAEFRGSIKTKIQQLPEYVLHSDLSNKNILVNIDDPKKKYCIIDFGDLQVGLQSVDLANSMLYNVLEQKRQPMEQAIKWIPHWVYKGYHSNQDCSLDDEELLIVPNLMKLRLCQSLLNGLVAIRQDPENDYVMNTNKFGGWELLQLLISHDPKELTGWWKNGPPK